MSRFMRHFTRCKCGALIKNITEKNPTSVCRMCGGMAGRRRRARKIPTTVLPRQVLPSVTTTFDPVAARVRWSQVR